jgi:hypothetical protein
LSPGLQRSLSEEARRLAGELVLARAATAESERRAAATAAAAVEAQASVASLTELRLVNEVVITLC